MVETTCVLIVRFDELAEKNHKDCCLLRCDAV